MDLILGLVVGAFVLALGLRKQSWFLAVAGGNRLFGALFVIFFMASFFLFALVPPELSFPIWFSVGILIWLAITSQAIKHSQRWVGKALFFFAVLWSGILAVPLIAILGWNPAGTLISALALCIIGFVLWSMTSKLSASAKARRDAFHRRIIEDLDSRRPPWE